MHFIPIHPHSFYRDKYGLTASDFPVANAEFERLPSLPLNPAISDAEVEHVIQATRDVAQTYRRQRRAA